MTRRDILLHVANHGTYHRGNVASMMYQAGVAPPTTDLPVFLKLLLGVNPIRRLGCARRLSSSAISRLMACEHDRELLVVFLFQGLYLAGELTIGVHQAAQLYERAHDGDIDFDGAR